MDKIGLLSAQDRLLLQEFSARCIDRLNDHFMLAFFLKVFCRFLEDNIRKEIEKDRLIIESVVRDFKAGKGEGEVDMGEIFEKTKDVDNDFLKKIAILPLTLEVRYDDIEDIRKERIALLVHFVFTVFRNWDDPIPFCDVVRTTFTEERFQEIITRILHLYTLETRMLSKSVKCFPVFATARNSFFDTLFKIMEKTGQDVAVEYTGSIFRGESLPCHNRT